MPEYKFIRHEDDKWCVYSHTSGRSFGCYDSKREAEERLRQMQMFKVAHDYHTEKMERCLQHLKDNGFDTASAHAICYATLGDEANKESSPMPKVTPHKAKQAAHQARLVKDMQHKAKLGELAQQRLADLQAETKEIEPIEATLEIEVEDKQEKCDEDYGYAEPYSPYGGATSFADALAAMEAQEQAMKMQEYLSLYNSIIANIASNESIVDKGAAIADAANELKKLLNSGKALEVESKAWATFAEGGKFCVYKVDADGNKTGDSIECYESRSEGNAKVEELYGKSLEKAGARHSGSDNEMIQMVHDTSVKLGAECGMKMLKGIDGQYYAYGWVSNKFRDRDTASHPKGEIITEAAHKEFISYLDSNPDKAPELWSWHTVGTARKSRAVWWEYADGYLTMLWPLTEDEAKGYADLDGVGMSHGFHVLSRNRKEGLIHIYRTFEASDLPLDVAANPFTDIDLIRKELAAMAMTKEKREYLVKRLGEEKVGELEKDTGAMSKALEEAGVEFKETQQTDATTSTAQTVQVESNPEAAMEALKELLNVDGLQHILKELQDTNKKLVERLDAQDKQLQELSKSTDEKVAEKIAPRVKPLQWGHQASASKENVLKPDEPLAKAAPDNWLAQVFSPGPTQSASSNGFSDGR